MTISDPIAFEKRLIHEQEKLGIDPLQFIPVHHQDTLLTSMLPFISTAATVVFFGLLMMRMGNSGAGVRHM
jgi:hypothetical protein